MAIAYGALGGDDGKSQYVRRFIYKHFLRFCLHVIACAVIADEIALYLNVDKRLVLYWTFMSARKCGAQKMYDK